MKNKIFSVSVIIIITLFMCNNTYSFNFVEKNINIGIIINTSSFMVECSKNFFITDVLNKKLSFDQGTIRIFCVEKNTYVNEHILTLPIKIESLDEIIFIESKPYRGYFIVKESNDSKLNVINVLSIEDYIKGVLPKEIGSDWELEALKAQAVISRTYAISNLNKHLSQGFDLCSTTHCQVYGGAGVETDTCNKALLLTQHEFLTYNRKFANTVFHANCGGHTENPKYIWNWKIVPPYLKGVKCYYCKNAPYTNWEKTLDESFIRKKLLNNNNIGKIKNIKIIDKTNIGTAKKIEILHSNGKLILNAYKFRLIVDAWQIKSHSFYSIKNYNNKFNFKGKGWGHKVGLCQWGAKFMAEKGKNYRDILYYFYPGTKISKIIYDDQIKEDKK
ncbi:MAG: SpoIID/LytB domain-containing protein [Endomicrobium sp.]|jgi:stage II sporulation protein D|nr:SpoIID/LytB domain-containing protein [Endomicrobium sp.]